MPGGTEKIVGLWFTRVSQLEISFSVLSCSSRFDFSDVILEMFH